MIVIEEATRRVLRQFAPLVIAVVLCVGSICFVLLQGERELHRRGNWVDYSYHLISKTEKLSTRIETMMSNNQAYLLTGVDTFREAYEADRMAISEKIAELTAWTADNPAQTSRVAELRQVFTALSVRMAERIHDVAAKDAQEAFIGDIQSVTAMRNSIMQINTAIQEHEYKLLAERAAAVEAKKKKYFRLLIGGLISIAALVMFFNYLVLRIHMRKEVAEAALTEMEKRYALAIDGTNDGIFDRNFVTGKVFYSRQFFGMLGIERAAYLGVWQDSIDHVHPDDVARKNAVLDAYIQSGGGTDYSNTFRMRHADGRWIWVQSRGRGVFDDAGRMLRLVGAHTDVTAEKEYQDLLEKQKRRAEEASRAKSDFLAQMSHEIRTPLTAISGIAEILQRNQSNLDGKQRQLLATLHSSTSTLKDIVNDVLDFSKIESGELELDNRLFDLTDVFEQVVSIMSVRVYEKGLDFTFDYDSLRGRRFMGDSVRLRQILINLTGNAVKFTDHGGIYIEAVMVDRNGVGHLEISVRDTGIGIAADHFEMIFERFKQGDASISRKYGGTGLGLSISRNLARLMGGDIRLESTIGEGSVFTVSLPDLAAQNGDMAADADTVDHAPAMAGEKRVLVVEDYEGNVVILGYFLDDLGCAYDIAGTGRAAIDMWHMHRYDAILMDVQMPEMDGFTATETIREIERRENLPRTPIIGMTAHALAGDRDKCIAAGMDAYLPKPLVEEDLRAVILRYLNAPPVV